MKHDRYYAFIIPPVWMRPTKNKLKCSLVTSYDNNKGICHAHLETRQLDNLIRNITYFIQPVAGARLRATGHFGTPWVTPNTLKQRQFLLEVFHGKVSKIYARV